MSVTNAQLIAETARLRLRHLAAADAPFHLRLLSDPDYIRFIGDRGIDSLAAAEADLCDRVIACYQRDGFGMYLMERRSDGLPVGMAGLVKRDFLEHVDLGYALLPEGRGQGFAIEAGRAVMQHAQQGFGLHRLAAITSIDNAASIKVLERLGFSREGFRNRPDSDEAVAYFECSLT